MAEDKNFKSLFRSDLPAARPAGGRVGIHPYAPRTLLLSISHLPMLFQPFGKPLDVDVKALPYFHRGFVETTGFAME
jgi:hypothetical protein